MKNYYYELDSINSNINYKQGLKKSFFNDNKPFYGFKKITEKRKKEIEDAAIKWNLIHDGVSKADLFYQVLNEIHANHDYKSPNDFYLAYGDESFLFFILTFDPNLEILQISFEELNKSAIQKRVKEQFGIFYDDRLRQIEHYYNEKYPTITDEFRPKR